MKTTIIPSRLIVSAARAGFCIITLALVTRAFAYTCFKDVMPVNYGTPCIAGYTEDRLCHKYIITTAGYGWHQCNDSDDGARACEMLHTTIAADEKEGKCSGNNCVNMQYLYFDLSYTRDFAHSRYCFDVE